MACLLCRMSKEPGWLCAAHPGQPWEHDGCGAEGAPCACSPSGLVRWRQVHADAGTGVREAAAAINRMLTLAPRLPLRWVGRLGR